MAARLVGNRAAGAVGPAMLSMKAHFASLVDQYCRLPSILRFETKFKYYMAQHMEITHHNRTYRLSVPIHVKNKYISKRWDVEFFSILFGGIFFQWKSYSVGFLSKSVGFPRHHIMTLLMHVARHFQASASHLVLL